MVNMQTDHLELFGLGHDISVARRPARRRGLSCSVSHNDIAEEYAGGSKNVQTPDADHRGGYGDEQPA